MSDSNQRVFGMLSRFVQDEISATPMDQTVSAEIVKLKNPSTNEYLVKFESATFSAFYLNPEVSFNAGELVYVLVPRGDFSAKKIILGRASAQDNLSYTEIYEASNFFIPFGPNWLDIYDPETKDYPAQSHLEKNAAICACSRLDRQALKHDLGANYTDFVFARWPYARSDGNKGHYGEDVGRRYAPYHHHFAEDRDPTWYPTPQILKAADEEVFFYNSPNAVVQLDWIGVKAKFRTQFLSEHFQGKYGLRIELLVENRNWQSYETTPKADRYNILTKEFTFDSFNGTPYSLVEDTLQTFYFQIDPGTIRGLNRISLFQNSIYDGATEEQIRNSDFVVDYIPVYNPDGSISLLPDNAIYDKNNIFCSEIDIRWYKKVNLLDYPLLVHISTEKGNRVYNPLDNKPGIDEVVLKAHLYHLGKDILNPDDFDVYWFRECPGFLHDPEATNSVKDSFGTPIAEFTPEGWAPIFRPSNVPMGKLEGQVEEGMFVNEFDTDRLVNQYSVRVPAGTPGYNIAQGVEWPPKVNGHYNPDDKVTVHPAAPYRIGDTSDPDGWRKLIVPRDRVPWEWYYRCVIVQKPQVEIKDTNGEIISSSKGDKPTFFTYTGEIFNSKVPGVVVIRQDSLYALELQKQEANTTGSVRSYLRIVDNYKLKYDKEVPYPQYDWKGNYWYNHDQKHLAPFSMYNGYGEYAGNFNNLLPQEKMETPMTKGWVDCTEQSIYPWVEFVVGAIDPKLYNDFKESITEEVWKMPIGILHKTLVPADDREIDVAWIGDREFVYNYDGTAKKWYSNEGFSMRPQIKFLNDTFSNAEIHFYGPEGVSPRNEIQHLGEYKKNAATPEDEGYSPFVPSMLRNIYVETGGNGIYGFHFSVKQVWNAQDAADTNNIIYMTIKLPSGKIVQSYCQFKFLKDGTGSNGTGWSCHIGACDLSVENQGTEINKKFSAESHIPHPLVLDAPNGIKGTWTQAETTPGVPLQPLIIRPFIYKSGLGVGARKEMPDGSDYPIEIEDTVQTDFFDFREDSGYWAETFWDVRYPSRAGKDTMPCALRYNSPLRLVYIGEDGLPENYYTKEQWLRESPTNKFEGSGLDNGEGENSHNAPVVPRGLAANPGVCAYTTSDRFFGAIGVRWANGTGPLLSDTYGAEFLMPEVVAITNIYRNFKNETGGSWFPNKDAGHKQLVTTLVSRYPVDLFLRFDRSFDFNPNMVYCNWPREVLYSGVGLNPEEAGKDLCFYYGHKTEVDDITGAVTELWGATAASHDFPWYPCLPMTSNIGLFLTQGKVTDNSNLNKDKAAKPHWKYLQTRKLGDKEEDLIEKEQDLILNFHAPEALQQTTLMHSLLCTPYAGEDLEKLQRMFPKDIFKEGMTDAEKVEMFDPFNGKGVYIRMQTFQMSRFSNNSINEWDGKSIKISDDNKSICAPLISAGYKDAASNTFTGIVMGCDENYRKDAAYNATKAGQTYHGPSGIEPTGMDKADTAYTGSQQFKDYLEANPYMAGLFGYQRGYVSFGLLENGTAFFGRADGGAQILLDGTNGVIGGGGNGIVSSPSVKDKMWNRMRINLIDLTRSGYREKTIPIRGKDTSAWKDAEDSPHVPINNNLHDGYKEGACNFDGNKDNAVELNFPSFFVDAVEGYNSNPEKLELPSWYKKIWQNAYIQRNGDYPWFLQPDLGYSKDPQSAGLPQWTGPIDNPEAGGGASQWWINYYDDWTLITNSESDAALNDSEGTYARGMFGYGRASSTPAIEIGQHIDGLRPGILDWCSVKDVFTQLYIPGNRNFMVTYDGTLWAMNGVFMGVVIGSNIIGGRMQGVELGVGCKDTGEPYKYQKIEDECDWPPLLAPKYRWTDDATESGVQIAGDKQNLPAFYVDQKGNVSCASIRIFGGSIDIGTFHIRGKDLDAQAENNSAYGELIQYGQSDLIGLTHCYGNLGVGPNLNGQSVDAGSNYGHFTQVKGQVMLGIVFSEGDPSVHESVAEKLGMNKEAYGLNSSKFEPYMAAEGSGIGDDSSMEAACFFGIDAQDIPLTPGDGNEYQGHFWPMAFRYSGSQDAIAGEDRVPGWFTTMNAFKSKAGVTPAAIMTQGDSSVDEGGNYFRVGPYGTEFRFLFCRENFESEDHIEPLTKDNTYGYFGTVERKGDPEGSVSEWAIGISSWGGSPIIMNSDSEFAVRTQGMCEFDCNPVQSTPRLNDHVPMGYGGVYTGFKLGNLAGDGGETKDSFGMIVGVSVKGAIQLTCPAEAEGDKNPIYQGDNIIPGDKCKGGITIRPYEKGGGKEGFWAWIDKEKEMHLMCGLQDNNGETAEIHMTKEHVGINTPGEFWIVVKKGAHNKGDGQPGLFISEEEVKIGGKGGHIKMTDEISFEGEYANEEKQKNIYARFA